MPGVEGAGRHALAVEGTGERGRHACPRVEGTGERGRHACPRVEGTGEGRAFMPG